MTGRWNSANSLRRDPNPATDSLTPYFLHEPGVDNGICPEFMTEAVSRFTEDEMAKTMLMKAIAGLSYQLANMTMSDDYKPYINVSCVGE